MEAENLYDDQAAKIDKSFVTGDDGHVEGRFVIQLHFVNLKPPLVNIIHAKKIQ